MRPEFFIYLAVMAGVTYLVRAIPLLLVKKPIKNKKCKTKLPRDAKTEELFCLIERAEKWLRENTYTTRILKWETKQWGEIPADFGRK